MLLLYVFLVSMAVGAVVIWSHPDWVGGKWATEWMPHIGTSAVTILVTIAVVDQIVRRQHSLPLRPRRERARRRIGTLGCSMCAVLQSTTKKRMWAGTFGQFQRTRFK
jgi:hypothetical protein